MHCTDCESVGQRKQWLPCSLLTATLLRAQMLETRALFHIRLHRSTLTIRQKRSLSQFGERSRSSLKSTALPRTSPTLDSSRSLLCERIVCRHGAMLLIVRECSGFNPRRWRHWRWRTGQRTRRLWKRQSRSGERNKKETNTKRQQTHAQTCDIMDGMWMEWNAHWDTLSHDVSVITCARCMRKNVWSVSVYTPVG